MSKKAKQKKSNAGFTLIELAIAISVFSLAILSAFSLAISNQRLAAENYDRVLAANLAREGVELVRNVRDSNWLAIDANVDCIPGGILNLCKWDENLDNNFLTISATDPLSMTDLSCGNYAACMAICSQALDVTTCRLFKNVTTEIFDHNVNGEITNMNRLIEIEHVCMGTDVSDPDQIVPVGASCASGDHIGLKVTVHVAWERFNKSHSTDVVEYLYNWR